MALKVTIVGVGMVGEQIVSILREREFPMAWPPRVCATRARPEVLAGEAFTVEEISADCFRGSEVAFFAGKEGAQGASVVNGLHLWCVADNLRKGAALNVVQIGEGLIERGILKP